MRAKGLDSKRSVVPRSESNSSMARVEGMREVNTLLRALIGITLVFLVLQFLSGMWVNLFVSFPSITQTQGFFGLMATMMSLMQSGVLMVHMMWGFLILFLSIVDLAVSLFTKKLWVVTTATSGFASVLFAGINGLLFVFSGFTNNLNSYYMAAGFLLAFASYFVALYILDRT